MVSAAAAAAAAAAGRVASEAMVVAKSDGTCGRCRGREVPYMKRVVMVWWVGKVMGWQHIRNAYRGTIGGHSGREVNGTTASAIRRPVQIVLIVKWATRNSSQSR